MESEHTQDTQKASRTTELAPSLGVSGVVFRPPSIDAASNHAGVSYTHHSQIPEEIRKDMGTPCVMGIDEAGRGPVLGPMVYSVFYLPLEKHTRLLADTHHFNDSKVLTSQVRSELMKTLCTTGSDLFQSCGWATRSLSARDISAGMLKPAGGMYNLNAQAMDATILLITEVLARGINIQQVYIDTIGRPQLYQQKLSKTFPGLNILVATKADRDYPCVSAASVCAKVTRDAALEMCYEKHLAAKIPGQDGDVMQDTLQTPDVDDSEVADPGWGSGYPSDAKCTAWLKANMDPFFGWGNECRFSWGTVKDMLESQKETVVQMTWPKAPREEDRYSLKLTDMLNPRGKSEIPEETSEETELAQWFGRPVAQDVF